MASARDIKRLEGITRSPVFSQLSTSIQGLTIIRAFSAEHLLHSEFDHQQDLHSSASFAFISASRCFSGWLDWIVVDYLGIVVYSFLVFGRGILNMVIIVLLLLEIFSDVLGGEVGLAIFNCIMLTGMVEYGVCQSAEVENLMTSVERVLEYSQLQGEDKTSKPNYNHQVIGQRKEL